MSTITHTETTEEFLARGGKVTVCDYSVPSVPIARKVIKARRPAVKDYMMTAELFAHLLGC